MANIFHKSCYTTRTTGYKYRTLATNTTDSDPSFGPPKTRKTCRENPLNRKFLDIKREIVSRVDSQVDKAQRAREANFTKFEKVIEKINQTVELKETVLTLRKTLAEAEGKLMMLVERVEKLNNLLFVDV